MAVTPAATTPGQLLARRCKGCAWWSPDDGLCRWLPVALMKAGTDWCGQWTARPTWPEPDAGEPTAPAAEEQPR